MTICLAAMADNSRSLVLATDQMLSWDIVPGMPAQYETADVPKVHELTPSVFALAAGNTAFAFDIVRATKRSIQELGATTVEQVAEVMRRQYQSYRRTLLIRWLLEPRGLDLATYYAEQKDLNPALVQQVDQQLSTYDVNVQVIVAGYDGVECHIYGLFNPGVIYCYDPIGFLCVGIGAPHAQYHLIGADYSKTLPLADVDRLVREAKSKSEKAPGVGEQTTIMYLPSEENGVGVE